MVEAIVSQDVPMELSEYLLPLNLLSEEVHCSLPESILPKLYGSRAEG